MNYYEKYIKYKNKYLIKKHKQYGGILENLSRIPDVNPKVFIKNFNTMLFFKEGVNDHLFIKMLYEGKTTMNMTQKKFMATYIKFLFNNSINEIKKYNTNTNNNNIDDTNIDNLIIKYIESENLNKNIIIDASIDTTIENKQIFYDFFDKILFLISLKNDKESTKPINKIIEFIKSSFYEYHVELPKFHYYLGIIGRTFYTNGYKIENTKIPIMNIIMIHSLSASIARKKSDERTIHNINLFTKAINKYGEDLSNYEYFNLISELIDNSKSSILYSSTSLDVFPLPHTNGIYDDTIYVTLEGNGRIAAIKKSIDNITEKYINFKPPKINIELKKFTEKIAIINHAYFNLLNFFNNFPPYNLEKDGWVNQIIGGGTNRFTDINIVKENPRYFGYVKKNEINTGIIVNDIMPEYNIYNMTNI
jgi:hypothetical protein